MPVASAETAAAAAFDDVAVVVAGADPSGSVEPAGLIKELVARGADGGAPPVLYVGNGIARGAALAAGASAVLAAPAYVRDVVTIGRILAGRRAGNRSVMDGDLGQSFGVFYLVRALAGTGATGTLLMLRGLRRGEIRFFEGEVTSAQVGGLHGQAALHQLLLWTEARFELRDEPVVRRQQIPLTLEELLTQAERFLCDLRDAAGSLSPSTVYEQDQATLGSMGRQLPTEVHGVLRMFDGHRTVADVLEDSPFRVLETLRVAERAAQVGLLRKLVSAKPRSAHRAMLAIEEWLVGGGAGEVARPLTPEGSGPIGGGKKGKKNRAKSSGGMPAVTPRAVVEVDWAALVPRGAGLDSGALSPVVPSSMRTGEIEVRSSTAAPSRGSEREKLEALTDAGERDRLFSSLVEVAEQEQLDAEEVAWRESERKARQALLDAEKKLKEEAAAKAAADAEVEKRAKAEADAKAKAEAEKKAKAEAEQAAKAEAKAKAEADAKAKAEAEKKAKDDAAAKAEADAKAKAEADAKAKAEADAKAKAEADAKAKAEADAKAKAEADAKAKAEADAKAKAEAEKKAKDEAAANAKAEAETTARDIESAVRARAEAEAAEIAAAKAAAEKAKADASKPKAQLEAEARAMARAEALMRDAAEADTRTIEKVERVETWHEASGEIKLPRPTTPEPVMGQPSILIDDLLTTRDEASSIGAAATAAAKVEISGEIRAKSDAKTDDKKSDAKADEKKADAKSDAKADEKKADAKADEKKADEKKTDAKADEKQADDKKAEDKKADEKKTDAKADDKQADKKADDKKADDKKSDAKADEKKADDKKADDKKSDAKADEKKADDKKAEDKKAVDKKAEDKKADDKKAEDKKADDKKPEEKSRAERRIEEEAAEATRVAEAAKQKQAAAAAHDAERARSDAQAAAAAVTSMFSDDEEEFFARGHAPHHKDEAAESFDDLDVGYQRVGFWDKLLGRRPKAPPPKASAKAGSSARKSDKKK